MKTLILRLIFFGIHEARVVFVAVLQTYDVRF